MIENWRVLLLLIMVAASVIAIAPNPDIDRTNLQFGLDIQGGTRLLLSPRGNISGNAVSDTVEILNQRANIYGLREIQIRPIGLGSETLIQIETSGAGEDIVSSLLSVQGRFEAKIEVPVLLSGDSGSLKIGDREYVLKVAGDEVEISGQNVSLNSSLTLDGIVVDYVNRTANSLTLLARAYTGSDIQQIITAPPRGGIEPVGNQGYRFFFSVLISPEGAKRFADITKNLPTYIDPFSGEEYLDSRIVLFLDGEEVSRLSIGADLKGRVVNEPQIQGFRADRKEVEGESLRLQTILRSGALPVSLAVVSKDVISPTLGSGFLGSAAVAALFAVLAVFLIILARYRSIRISLPMTVVAASEIIIILGIASTNDTYVWLAAFFASLSVVTAAYIKKHADLLSFGVLIVPLAGMISWTIDLAAIAGIIATIGTGIDQQIIIADEALRGRWKEETYLLKEKLKRAFFIIFSAAAANISSMLPLLTIGTGLLRGFAITAIIGILSGFLVTRPAYGAVIERLLKR